MQMQVSIVSVSCLVVQCAPVANVIVEDDSEPSRGAHFRGGTRPRRRLPETRTDAAPPAGQHCGLRAAGAGCCGWAWGCDAPAMHEAEPASWFVPCLEIHLGSQRPSSTPRIPVLSPAAGPARRIPLGISAPPPVTLRTVEANKIAIRASVAEQPHRRKTHIFSLAGCPNGWFKFLISFVRRTHAIVINTPPLNITCFCVVSV